MDFQSIGDEKLVNMIYDYFANNIILLTIKIQLIRVQNLNSKKIKNVYIVNLIKLIQ